MTVEHSIITRTSAADGTVALDMEAAVQDNLYQNTSLLCSHTYELAANKITQLEFLSKY